MLVITFLETIFWGLGFLLVYPYLVYPLLLKLFIRLGWCSGMPKVTHASHPRVTFIISAYNEASVINEKLHNTLEIHYPPDRFEVIVISDASDDGTDDIVKQWHSRDPRVRLVRQEERRGKSSGLNLGVVAASGDIIVFSDANAMYEPDAVNELVAFFGDNSVGYVMGAALYNKKEADCKATESEGLYWRFELALKQLETEFYSVVGGDGAIYAIRKELYFPLRDEDINDFINPLQIVARGYRGIFNSRAVCYEDAAEAFDKEFKRKRRIANRSWRAVKHTIATFKLFRDARFLWTLFSHKVIRWFSMPLILVLFLTTLALVILEGHPIYIAAFTAQIYMFTASFIGAFLDKNQRSIPKFIYLPYYFYLVYYAAMLGIWDEKKGIKHVVWNHVRDQEANSGKAAGNGQSNETPVRQSEPTAQP